MTTLLKMIATVWLLTTLFNSMTAKVDSNEASDFNRRVSKMRIPARGADPSNDSMKPAPRQFDFSTEFLPLSAHPTYMEAVRGRAGGHCEQVDPYGSELIAWDAMPRKANPRCTDCQGYNNWYQEHI